MTTNATTAAPLVTRILHLPITSDAEAFVTVARATERAVVQLGNPGFENRDGLSRFIVRGIETELGRLGAAPPGWQYDDGLEAILSDQLYRARLLGCFGLALSLPSLRDLADASGQLGAEDSRTLRRLVALAEREPLQLYLPRPCAELRVVGNPEPLSTWLPTNPEPGRVASIEYDDASGEPAEPELDSSEPPPVMLVPPRLEAFMQGHAAHATTSHAAASRDAVCAEAVSPEAVSPDATSRAAASRAAASHDDGYTSLSLDETPFPPPLSALAKDADPDDMDADGAFASDDDAFAGDLDADEAFAGDVDGDGAFGGDVDSSDAFAGDVDGDSTPAPPSAQPETPLPDAEVVATSGAARNGAAEAPAPAAPVAPLAPITPIAELQRSQRCLAWAAQLGSMQGPKVHGSIEKAFITAYLPLCREIASGTAPAEASAAAERWAEGFAQSYAAAFRQLGSNARRPRMVKDVIEVGVRWLGQHHARQCQLLLVSAMRFDLGQRLNEELERRFAAGAVCADQCLLWAALPSNAEAQQLDGPDLPGARRTRSTAAVEPTGHSAIARFPAGNRELFKLDHIPQEIAQSGEAEAVRLGRLAVELADRIEPWMRQQPPETLIVLFGDHGFHWQTSARGTGAAQRGGALPEQVIVSASAWLLRESRQQKARVAPGIH